MTHNKRRRTLREQFEDANYPCDFCFAIWKAERERARRRAARKSQGDRK